MPRNNKTFIRITNEQVYKELCDLKIENAEQHRQILNAIENNRLENIKQIEELRGRLNAQKIALYGIGSLTMALLGWFILKLI